MFKNLSLIAVLLVSVSCATKSEKKDIQVKAEQNQVTDAQKLGGSIHDLIQNSKNLNDSQRKELNDIIAKNKALAMELSEKSYQYRGVLIEELLSGKSTPKRISILKSDIKKVEAARLKNTFDTVEKISKIVSKHADNKEYADHLKNIERIIR